MSYYEEMAHVRFTLKKLQEKNPTKNSLEEFANSYEHSLS